MELKPYLPTIWAVDDNPHNSQLLQKILHRENFRVVTYNCGSKLLKGIARATPDLVLLDIDMPGLSGYQLCERLKSEPDTRHIPVIFISALTDLTEKKAGFRAGGADYITKPFEAEEVVMRINNHLQISSLRNQLAEQNMNLEAIVQQRTAELELAHKQLKKLDDIKSEFLKFISHELRTPLVGLLGVIDLLMEELGDKADEVLTDMFVKSRQRILNLIDDALLLIEIESFPENLEKSKVELQKLLEISIFEATQMEAGFSVETGTSNQIRCRVMGDGGLMVKAFKYLLVTAFKFCQSGTPLKMTIDTLQTEVTIKLEAKGKSVTDKTAESFFDFHSDARASSHAESVGLAPVIASKIITLFDGTVNLTKLEKNGVVCAIMLPILLPSNVR